MAPPPAARSRKESDGLWVPKPPDGGWGWVIMLASFAVNFVWGGLFNSYGILYKEFLVYFGQSRGYTSLIGSVLNGLGYGAGIIASALMNRYGIRSVAIVGGAIGGITCALCMFADSVLALIFLFGGGVGIGHALSYTAAYIIVPYYFEKRRGMATGVAIAGSGIGNIVCAPLMRYLLKEYTWRGFVVIEGGIILQCCVFAALFRSVPFVRLQTKEDEMDDGLGGESENDPMLTEKPKEDNGGLRGKLDTPRSPKLVPNGSPRFRQAHTGNRLEQLRGSPDVETDRSRPSRKYSDITEYKQATSTTAAALPTIPESNGAEIKDRKNRARLYSQQFNSTDRRPSFLDRLASDYGKEPRRHTHVGDKPFMRKDIYFAGSLLQLDEYRSNPELFWQSALSLPVATGQTESSTAAAAAFAGSQIADGRPLDDDSSTRTLCQRIDKVLGLRLLARLEFLFFALAIFGLYFGYYVPYTVLYDFALEKGVPDKHAVLLISVMGVANTLGRVVLGSVADFRCVNRTIFFAMIMFLMGTSCCFCVFYSNFYVMAVYAAVFAMGVGASKAMTLIVTVDLVGLENLTHAYGLLLLFQGLGFILGNPFAGWMHDLTRSYVIPFSIIGALLIVSGFLILMASRWRKKRTQKK